MLKKILNEGRYDRLVSVVTKNIMKKVKSAYVHDFNTLVPDEDISRAVNKVTSSIVGTYNPYGILFMCKVLKLKNAPSRFTTICSGRANINSKTITLIIAINSDNETRNYSELISKIKENLRHEIEHMTHVEGIDIVKGKKKYSFDVDKYVTYGNYFKYITQPVEVDANIHGLYAKAKYLKQPYKEVFREWMDKAFAYQLLTAMQVEDVYSIYSKRIKKIGGIPSI